MDKDADVLFVWDLCFSDMYIAGIILGGLSVDNSYYCITSLFEFYKEYKLDSTSM